MKRQLLGLAALLTMSSCASGQLGGVVTGTSIGGMFGSAIGGLMGGPRGSDAGTVIGMVAGAAAGAAVTAPKTYDSDGADYDYSSDNSRYDRRSDDIDYGYTRRPAGNNRYDVIEVSNLRFTDENDNRFLDAGEHAYLEMDVYNRGEATLYDVAPLITCDNKRVLISPAAIISTLPAGRGVRYKAAIIGKQNLRSGNAGFKISFGQGHQRVTAKSFHINTQR